MKRLELAHLLRAACDIAGDREVLVIGSQSILGAFDEDDLPPAATASIEADIAFLEDPDRTRPTTSRQSSARCPRSTR